jgi:hypothetical protein
VAALGYSVGTTRTGLGNSPASELRPTIWPLSGRIDPHLAACRALKQPKAETGEAIGPRFDRTRPEAKLFGPHVQEVAQFDLTLPDTVAEFAAIELSEFGARKFAPGDLLLRHQGRDFATQNVGLSHVIRPLSLRESVPPVSLANCLKMVNETLTLLAFCRHAACATPQEGRSGLSAGSPTVLIRYEADNGRAYCALHLKTIRLTMLSRRERILPAHAACAF